VKIRRAPALILTVGLHLLSGCGLFRAAPHIAFLGDSITQLWWYPTANLGRSGDTTSKMLARFPLIVPGRGYTTVVLLGGTNDILLGIAPDETLRNLEALGRQTVQQHAEPVLCTIPPIFHSWVPGDTKDYKPQVLELNRRIAQLAIEHDWKLVDFYTPLVDHPGYSTDGVHMKRSGYLVMVLALHRVLRHRLPSRKSISMQALLWYPPFVE
jgi:lysophospholipase L1-like esterase